MSFMNKQGNGEHRRVQSQSGGMALFNFLTRGAKKMGLLCLFPLFIIAAPVQGQGATDTPVAPTQVTNPTAVTGGCGLPPASSQFNSASTITTFTLRADCTYNQWTSIGFQAIMYITSGTFTINGNGHTITGPPHSQFLYMEGTQSSNTVVNLNDVIIQRSGVRQVIFVRKYSTLNGRNIIFRNNTTQTVLNVRGGTVNLQNVQFLNNIQTTAEGAFVAAISAITDRVNPITGATVVITNGIFRGNRNSGVGPAYNKIHTIVSAGTGTSVTLNGCATFADNLRATDNRALYNIGVTSIGDNYGTYADNSVGRCEASAGLSFGLAKRKSKKTATPRPSATARPLATTCIDMSLASGIVVHATYGLGSGVQCQRLGGGGIGFQALADSFIDAVDVWGYVEQGVEVCFPQSGELLFLDARMMPRAIAPLVSTVVNGMTCGAIDSPGSIVLMPAAG